MHARSQNTRARPPLPAQVVWCSADKEYRVVVPIGVTFHTLAAPSRLWVNRTMVPDGSAEYTYRQGRRRLAVPNRLPG